MELSGKRKRPSVCDPCKGENEDEPAVSYCTVCNEYLCHGCRKAHTKTTVTKSHELMDQDSMPKQKPRSDKDSLCPKHNDKPIEFYCNSDGQFCCSVCALNDHKQCSTQYINDIKTNFHKSNEYVALEKASADLIRRLEANKCEALQSLQDVATLYANFISDLQNLRTEINNKIDFLEKTALSEAQIIKDSEKKTVESVATRCDSMLSDIHEQSSKLKELIKYKQERQLVIYSKSAADNVKTYDKRAKELSKQTKIKHYKFQPNEKIRQFLDSLDTLGHMKELKDGGETNSQTKCPDVSARSPHQLAASHVGNIDVRHPTDKVECWITGGVMVDKTNLAFVDRNNFSVKVADVDTNTLVSCIKLTTQPWDITCVNQDQIVVTCSGDNKGKLVFLKVGKTLSVLKELDIICNCQGIVYSSGLLFATFDHPESSVKIMNLEGEVLNTFKTNKAGDSLFSYPVSISLSPNQKNVFVSDWINNTVTSLTLNGTVQHIYTENSLAGPRGLAVDRNGSVYIAGHWSKNVHQLSYDGSRSQVILDWKRGVDGPWMVTYCTSRHRLYISLKMDGCYRVSVYQLQT